tara:strand:- start:1980 stop:2234 length:255 start_codon:yes stop_codon:yes gene_type:complete
MGFDDFNSKVFTDIKFKSLFEESEKNERYWVNVAEMLSMYKEKLEKNGDPVYDRLQDLLNMAIQQGHIYNALIQELTIIKHGGS